MTDKQIIIDDVDVSGCSYGEIEKSIFKCSCEYNVRSASMFCKDNPNCYYKQLKRKEQECERLREERDTWHFQWEKRYEICESLSDDIDKLCEQLYQLKAENEELKKCYKNNSALLDFEETNTTKLVNKVMKLEKTLTEIKDIALKSDMPPCLDIDCKCEYCKDSVTNKGFNCMQYGLEQILQKISEVEDG